MIELQALSGIVLQPPVLQGRVGAEKVQAYPVRITADDRAIRGVNIVAMDITLDGRRYGQWFDFVVNVE